MHGGPTGPALDHQARSSRHVPNTGPARAQSARIVRLPASVSLRLARTALVARSYSGYDEAGTATQEADAHADGVYDATWDPECTNAGAPLSVVGGRVYDLVALERWRRPETTASSPRLHHTFP
jgi:hypothetical protein